MHNGVVFPAGNLLRPIPRLNPTPDEDIDQLRRQGRASASSSILHVRADHSGCQGVFWLGSGTLCGLERLFFHPLSHQFLNFTFARPIYALSASISQLLE